MAIWEKDSILDEPIQSSYKQPVYEPDTSNGDLLLEFTNEAFVEIYLHQKLFQIDSFDWFPYIWRMAEVLESRLERSFGWTLSRNAMALTLVCERPAQSSRPKVKQLIDPSKRRSSVKTIM